MTSVHVLKVNAVWLGRACEYWIGLTVHEHCGSSRANGCRDQYVENSVCSDDLSETHQAYNCCQCRSRWRWVDGTSMDYMNWLPNEPAGNQALCGALGLNLCNCDQWFDTGGCGYNLCFICKRSAPTTPGDLHKSNRHCRTLSIHSYACVAWYKFPCSTIVYF